MYLSGLVGRPVVDATGRSRGRLRDVVARLEDSSPPRIVGIVARHMRRDVFSPMERLERLDVGGTLRLLDVGERAPFERRAGEVLLARDVMDGQVIDLRAPRVVRVNDVLIERVDDVWHAAGVDLSLRALLRRLLPRWMRLHDHATERLRWTDLELLASEVPGHVVAPRHEGLARLHPVDIARVANAVPARQATEIVASLDDGVAAHTMEEMVDEKQADVVEELDPERAADILERMPPDAAADVLAELGPDVVDAVLRRMEPHEAADVHALLTYPKASAGGLMTSEYVMAPRELRVEEARDYLCPQLERAEWVYYIYVVADERERRLLGMVSLRDLLLAEGGRRIDEVMEMVPRRVYADTPASRVAQIMSEYNLLTLPVTDAEGRLLGIISMDDALEVILPVELQRRIPRVFR